jgi:hypothetical protein
MPKKEISSPFEKDQRAEAQKLAIEMAKMFPRLMNCGLVKTAVALNVGAMQTIGWEINEKSKK